MADQVQWRGGSRQNSDQFTGAPREVTVDTSDWILRVHDGVTPGGHKMMKVNDCLVVETADKCNPNAPSCKVTVNGELNVEGDTNLHDTIIDGNLVVNGDFIQDGITLAVKTDEVILTNPGKWENPGGGCDLLPDTGNMLTQEDANQYISRALAALENAICSFDLAAIDEIQDIKDDLEKVWLAIAGLEVRVANLESDMAAVMARLTLIEQAIALIETEIEAIQNNVTENSKAIEALKVLVADLTQDLNDLENLVSNLKLDDLTDCAVPAPKDGQQLVFRNGQWVAEDNAFSEQAVHFMGFINVEDDSAPTGGDVKPGDTYIQHKVDETDATANSTWTGIAGEQVSEGQYVMYGADSKWHKGKTVESVDQIQSDWAETDVASPSFIKSKPDIPAIIAAEAGDGQINVDAGDGLSASGLNATANQKGNTTRTLSIKTGNGISIDGNGNVIIDPNFNLDGNITDPGDGAINFNAGVGLSESGTNATANQTIGTVKTFSVKTGDGITIDANGNVIIDPSFNLDGYITPPNNGVLTVKDHTGTTVGTFTANQAGNTEVTLPEGFSGNWSEITGKPCLYECDTYIQSRPELY